MKEVTRTIVESGDTLSTSLSPTNVGSLSINCDSSYFNSYSHFAIHHEMLNVGCFY